ncbi:Chaperone protein HscB [gamma proteobacterium IMCC1989]|nr:Chaperone protein HscB [gamma proteobacterium IMCC1989]
MDFTQNYFDLLKVSQGFFIDKGVLSANYRDLQKTFHPDKSANKPASEQRTAVQFAGYINTAYETLLSPVERATYLLLLAGEVIDDQSTTVNDGQFLFLQMEWRESLAEIKSDRDADSAEELLEALLVTVKQAFAELEVAFSQQYVDKEFLEAKNTIAKMQFVVKMLKEIDSAEAALFD